MNDFGIAILAWIFLVIAFTFEGLSHGWRWKASNIQLATIKIERKMHRRWHAANVVFQLFLVLGIYFLCLGSEFSWNYKFNAYFLYDMIWIMVHVALVRYSTFAGANNLSRGVGIDYIGNTAMLDTLYWKYIYKWFPKPFVMLLKIAVLGYTFLSIT